MGEETPSERSAGRTKAHNRWHGASDPPTEEVGEPQEAVELPHHPYYCHQYWFIDIRYLVKLKDKWVYSICIIEGVSRAIIAGMDSRYQDDIAILQFLHAANSDYGLLWGLFQIMVLCLRLMPFSMSWTG